MADLRTNHTRKLGSIKYVSGGRESLELDKNGVLLRLLLRLRYTVTNTATSPVGPLFQTLSRLIQRIEILAGGRDVVQSIPGYMLAARASYEQGCPSYGMSATVVTTGSAATTYDVILPVDFTLPLGARMDDAALDTTGLSQLSAIITWGKSDASDLFATPNGATISNVTLDVEGKYITDPLRDAKTGMALSGMSGKPYLVRHLDYQEIAVPATNNAFSAILDSRTGLVVTSFMIVQLADNVGVDTVVNTFRMESGSKVYCLRDAPLIRAENARDLRLLLGTTAGCLYIEPRIDGSVLNSIDTATLPSELKAVMDVTLQGTVCKLAIQREALRPMVR